jgi:multiple sugar transport system ATP-binding protein
MSGDRAKADIEFVEAGCQYAASDRLAVDGLNLHIDDGEFMVLVGPSGSGKSTALRMLAGLEEVSYGEIRIGGVDVSDLPPRDRDVAMVFQNYALYPNMSVGDNMGFALKLAHIGKAERRRRVEHAARTLELEQLLERKPSQLSGGQRQRVAMGRAIVREPKVFLMDEPLSNLDAKLRVQTRAEIAKLQRRLGVTTVYVTHDQVEAMTMGHRVAVLCDGVLQQVETPRALYDRPANVFVAGFIGSPAMNLFDAELLPGDDGVAVGRTSVPLSRATLDAASAAECKVVTLGVRPEVLRPSEGGLDVAVAVVEQLGSDSLLHCECTEGPKPIDLVVRVDGHRSVAVGDRLSLAFQPADLHVFDPRTGVRLG